MSKLSRFQLKHLKFNVYAFAVATIGIDISVALLHEHPTLVLVLLTLLPFQLGFLQMIMVVVTDILEKEGRS